MHCDGLYQISAFHFCVGMVINDGYVTRCPAIIAYMRGWEYSQVKEYCRKKKWLVKKIEEQI